MEYENAVIELNPDNVLVTSTDQQSQPAWTHQEPLVSKSRPMVIAKDDDS